MKRTRFTMSLLVTLVMTGCTLSGPAIMQEDPNDPAGSASIGTGSVTSGSTIPEEAKAAGIGLAP